MSRKEKTISNIIFDCTTILTIIGIVLTVVILTIR